MKEEKMMILTMLEEGKITSEEAIKLMEALEDVEMTKDYDEKSQMENEKFQDKGYSKPLFNTLEDIGSDIGNVLSNMFDGLKELGNSFGFKHSYETITTDLDLDLSTIENPSLELKAINGSIGMRPTDMDKLFIKVTCQYKNGLFSLDEPYFDFYVKDNKVVFNPKYNNNISIKLDVLLPKKHYEEIVLDSTNGKIGIWDLNVDTLNCITTNSSIDIVDINAKEIDLATKNGRIECRDTSSNIIKANTTNSNIFLMNIECKEIDVRTANAKIILNDIDGERIGCKTSNGSIEVEDISCDIIHLNTSNGRIICNEIDTNKIKDIRLITSNSSINFRLPNSSRDTYFDLETSMGNINLEIPNLIYKTNRQVNLGLKNIVAHSVDFDENKDHLRFIASTSNGSIKIY